MDPAADGRGLRGPGGRAAAALTNVLVPVRRAPPTCWRGGGLAACADDVSHVARVGGRTVTVIGARPGERDVPPYGSTRTTAWSGSSPASAFRTA